MLGPGGKLVEIHVHHALPAVGTGRGDPNIDLGQLRHVLYLLYKLAQLRKGQVSTGAGDLFALVENQRGDSADA